MLFEHRLWICQESEHACSRGMRTGAHGRGCVVCRLRVRVHLTLQPRQRRSASSETPPKVTLCSVFPSQFPANRILTNVSPCCLSSRCLAHSSPLNPLHCCRRCTQRMDRKTRSREASRQRCAMSYISRSRGFIQSSLQTPPTSGVRSASTAVSPQASDIPPLQKLRSELTRTK